MALAIIVGYIGLVVAGAFAGGYGWYRLVSWPRHQRDARENRIAIVQSEHVSVASDEVTRPRPESFVRWLTGRDMRA
jgi:hypothetical protein